MRGAKEEKSIVRVLIYREDDYWIAHCLEYDLLGDGKTVRTALKRLMGVIETQISYLKENDLMEQLYHPAPLQYWRRFATARPLPDTELVSKKEFKPKIPDKLPVHEMARLILSYRESAIIAGDA